jgi:hypothetical protein
VHNPKIIANLHARAIYKTVAHNMTRFLHNILFCVLMVSCRGVKNAIAENPTEPLTIENSTSLNGLYSNQLACCPKSNVSLWSIIDYNSSAEYPNWRDLLVRINYDRDNSNEILFEL